MFSTPSTSARYGRRSSNSQLVSPYSKHYISADMDTYIVPKIDDMNLRRTHSDQESVGFKPVYRNAFNSSGDNDSGKF